MKRTLICRMGLLWMLCGAGFVAQGAPPAPEATAVPATPVAPVVPVVPPVLSANDTEAITKSMGAEITVEGKVLNAFWVRNQVLMITFREEKEGFIAVSFAKHREVLNTAFGGDILAAVKGKNVQVTGKVTEHNYRPQIVIERAEQLRVVEETP